VVRVFSPLKIGWGNYPWGDVAWASGWNIPIVTTDDVYWPVPGVVKPQHLWPFSQTGDYSDHGSTGGLTLTAEGSGNSFGAGGLILNGSGWAESAANADLYNLGSTFSILIEINTTNTGNIYPLGCCIWGTDGYVFQVNNLVLNWRCFNPAGTLNEAAGQWVNPAVSSGVTTQLIITQSYGNNNLYINGSLNIHCPITFPAPIGASTPFAVGTYTTGGGFNFVGTIKRVGVLKGTAWSASDVAAIYANYP
jgi:hypothetical protein